MTTYVASSKEMCARLSKNKCLGPFKDVRIIVIGKDLTRKKKKEKKREAVELFFFFFWVSMGGRRNSIGLENLQSWVLTKV